MRSYALKVRVDNGPGHIGMEIQMARLLRVRLALDSGVCVSLNVWMRCISRPKEQVAHKLKCTPTNMNDTPKNRRR